MIIARTAVRISLFGGGTEYPNWVEHGNKGLVIGGTINKYSYIMLRSLPGFFDYKSKIAYSEIEHVKNNQEIQHKVINALVNYYAPNDGLEITHLADLPSKSGIGSSSTFLVCLLHALITYKNLSLNKTELLNKAIEFEQDILKEDVGYQDSAWAVHGGFNTIQFEQNRKITVVGAASETFISDLERYCLLMYTGISRHANKVASSYCNNLLNKVEQQNRTFELAEKAIGAIENNNIEKIGRLMHQSWLNKKTLSDEVTSDEIEHLYNTAIANGALGGKVLGAGGGGMMLIIADPKYHKQIKSAFSNKVFIPFKFENNGGSRIILNNG
jgi:D-glycero-alpha-D-manno-heptose-7-phosphate kinase